MVELSQCGWVGVTYEEDQVASPLETWRQDNFGTISDSGDAADNADPDQDGVTNINEYIAGTDPRGLGQVPHKLLSPLAFSTPRTSHHSAFLSSRSTSTPSAGLVETPALAPVSSLTALNLKILTRAPTTRPTSRSPRDLPGQKRGPCPKPK